MTGWTAGQYRLWRGLVGILILAQWTFLWPGLASVDLTFSSFWEGGLSVLIIVSALSLVLGIRSRLSAVLILAAYSVLLLFDFEVVRLADPSFLPLCFHLFIPAGSVQLPDARGREGSRSGWQLPAGVWRVLHTLLTLALASLSASMLLPLFSDTGAVAVREIALATLGGGCAIGFSIPGLRRYAWFASLSLLLFFAFGGLYWGLLALLLLAFEPAWLGPIRPGTTDRVFFDDSCGICRCSVHFLITEDRDRTSFRFAPQKSRAYLNSIPSETRGELPDSVVVLQESGKILVYSDAAIDFCQRLGGYWRVIGAIGKLIPRFIRDYLYQSLARVRYRLFPMPKENDLARQLASGDRLLPGALEEWEPDGKE